MALYRIVQAGLTNSFLHGRARNVRVLIQGVEGTLHLSIEDDGSGAMEVHEGIGLAGMRERLSPFGGTLTYEGAEGGFLVKATVPLETKDVHA
jgi:signal transduction histidine kinase